MSAILRFSAPYSEITLLLRNSLIESPTSLASRRFFDQSSTDARPQFDAQEGEVNSNPLEVGTHSSKVDTGTSEVNTPSAEVSAPPPHINIHAGKANSLPNDQHPLQILFPRSRIKAFGLWGTAHSLSASDPLSASLEDTPGKVNVMAPGHAPITLNHAPITLGCSPMTLGCPPITPSPSPITLTSPYSARARDLNQKKQAPGGACVPDYRLPLIYGFPFAFGPEALPMNPARARMVRTYGRAWR